MKVLVIGGKGFIGSHVAFALRQKHEVYTSTTSKSSESSRELYLDLNRPASIKKVLDTLKPNVLINCAGVVENTKLAEQNPTFTKNLLNIVAKCEFKLKKIIICGSASEYGLVKQEDIPVKETTPLNAKDGYGLSKLNEEKIALKYASQNKFPIVIVRIFNPIGAGMHKRFLIPSLVLQMEKYKNGTKSFIEVSRLDSMRDYVNVKDVALAIGIIIENSNKKSVYNIGSGTSTPNSQLIDLVAKYIGVKYKPAVLESNSEPEPLVAIQADISRIQKEYNWSPKYSLHQTVKEIIDAAKTW